MTIDVLFLLLIGGLIGALSGYLGSFMVVKRMSLVGDALSHVALPGMAVSILFGINPMLGAFAALSVAIIGIWYLSEHSEIYPEALVGVFFTASLAIGILITPEPELFEALFGNIEKVTRLDGFVIIAAAIVMFVATKFISKKILLSVISEDLAKAGGVPVSVINLVYLLLVGAIVALGVRFVGTLLTGALVIIPAATAKNVAGGIGQFQITSIVIGIVSAILGLIISGMFSIASGPAIVLVSIFLFIVSYIIKNTVLSS